MSTDNSEKVIAFEFDRGLANLAQVALASARDDFPRNASEDEILKRAQLYRDFLVKASVFPQPLPPG